MQFKSKALLLSEMWGAAHDSVLTQTMIPKKRGEISSKNDGIPSCHKNNICST